VGRWWQRTDGCQAFVTDFVQTPLGDSRNRSKEAWAAGTIDIDANALDANGCALLWEERTIYSLYFASTPTSVGSISNIRTGCKKIFSSRHPSQGSRPPRS
jgi:hypothetical protein